MQTAELFVQSAELVANFRVTPRFALGGRLSGPGSANTLALGQNNSQVNEGTNQGNAQCHLVAAGSRERQSEEEKCRAGALQSKVTGENAVLQSGEVLKIQRLVGHNTGEKGLVACGSKNQRVA